MRNKRRIIYMLRNADEKTVERLSAEYPQAERNHKDEMYAKVRNRMNNNESIFAEEVGGVEKYTRRPLWKIVPTAVLSLVLIGGAIGGSAMMLKNNGYTLPATEIEETTAASDNNGENAGLQQETTMSVTESITTESTTVSTEAVQAAETTAVQANGQTNITKEEIYAICEKGQTSYFDKISYTCKQREDYDTGYHMDYNYDVRVDNTMNTSSDTTLLGYYKDDNSIVYENRHNGFTYHDIYAYIFNSSSPDDSDEENNRKLFDSYEAEPLNYFINDTSLKAQDLLKNLNTWDITGTEEYLGRKCVIVSGMSDIQIYYEGDSELDDMLSCEFTLTIDIETGIWMKSDIKNTNYDLAHYTSAITEIAFGDAAKAPMSPSEFKQLVIDNNCVTQECIPGVESTPYNPVTEADLAYLN